MKTLKFLPFQIFITIVILLFLTYVIAKKIKRHKIRKRVMQDSDINPNEVAINIKNGISKGRELYKKLITAVHPDRFIEDVEKQKIATELSAKISLNRRNYAELVKLRSEVELLLGIKIK